MIVRTLISTLVFWFVLSITVAPVFAQEDEDEVDPNGEVRWWAVGTTFRTNFNDPRAGLAIFGEGKDAIVIQTDEDLDSAVRPVGSLQLLFPVLPWLEVGPSILAEPGENIIDKLCAGPTFAFKRGGMAFGVGVAVCAQPNAVFADPTFVPGLAPPGGATEIRTFTKTNYTTAITFTFSGVKRPTPTPRRVDPQPPRGNAPDRFVPLSDR